MCALQLTSAWEPVYAGEGVIYAGASGDLEALTELVNVPVITQVAWPISSASAASTPSTASGMDGARSETMPKLSGRLENAGAMCHHETKVPEVTP
jgi:hypothetical protein